MTRLRLFESETLTNPILVFTVLILLALM